MTMVARGIGGLMMVYSALYLAQFLFSPLYDNPQRVWAVMNVISGLGILVALVVNLRRMRSQSDGNPVPRRGTHTLFYANAALAIWFFHNWISLLTLEAGEATSVHHEVVWQLIAMMIPLVLATTGWRLWRENFRQP
ncbi:MAG: hypothetical protein OXG36_15070 [Caldilineaceae bacterium]|nr:hypothetical protein [Caldilineaceae bacterium]